MKQPKVNKLISYIIDMCHAMGLKVIAEGVETDQERLALMYKKCDMYQGYLLSKPIPAKEFYEKYCDGEKSPIIYCVGHTHIDCAWLWTLRVTEDKAVRSFSTVLELMKEYPEYVFMSSQPSCTNM